MTKSRDLCTTDRPYMT